MADTAIEWSEKVWNPVRGCTLVSPGCAHCYAMGQAHRFSGKGGPYEGLTKLRASGGAVWTGEVREVSEMLDAPLHWRKPTRVFVNSMSDLFHEEVSDDFIAAVFGVMAFAPGHTFQVLTKRAERLPKWEQWLQSVAPHGSDVAYCAETAHEMMNAVTGSTPIDGRVIVNAQWPLPNVHLGVSVEDSKHGLPRIEHLRRVPAAVRWLSVEPLLEDLGVVDLTGISWVVVGAESGHGARPFHEDWVRSLRDQCAVQGVAFFYKQRLDEKGRKVSLPLLDGVRHAEFPR